MSIKSMDKKKFTRKEFRNIIDIIILANFIFMLNTKIYLQQILILTKQ